MAALRIHAEDRAGAGVVADLGAVGTDEGPGDAVIFTDADVDVLAVAGQTVQAVVGINGCGLEVGEGGFLLAGGIEAEYFVALGDEQ